MTTAKPPMVNERRGGMGMRMAFVGGTGEGAVLYLRGWARGVTD